MTAFKDARLLLKMPTTRAFFDAMVGYLADADGRVDMARIDALAFWPHLSDISIYQRLPDQDDFECVLAGDRIRARWGVRLMGRTARSFAGPRVQSHFIDPLNRLIDDNVLAVGLTVMAGGVGEYAERVMVPITRRGGDAVIMASAYDGVESRDQSPGENVFDRLQFFDCRTAAPAGQMVLPR